MTVDSKEFLNCTKCKKRFKSIPFNLPCGFTVCREHLDDNEDQESFNCFICNDHEIKIDDCYPNRNIEIELYRQRLESSLESLTHEFETFKKKKYAPKNFSEDMFAELRNQVNIRKEQAIKSVNTYFEELHESIKELENNHQHPEDIKFGEYSLDEFVKRLDDLKLNTSSKEKNVIEMRKILKRKMEHAEYLQKELNSTMKSLSNYTSYKLSPCTDINLENIFGKIYAENLKYNLNFNLISSAENGEIKIWNEEKCVKTLDDHKDTVWGLKHLPNGQLASCSRDKTIKIWDIEDGKCIKTLEGHSNAVCCLRVLSSGRLISGSYDNTIKVWNINTKQCIKTLRGHSSTVWCIKLLSDRQLLSGSWDNSLKVWDLNEGTCVRTLTDHTSDVYCLKRLPSGEYASGSADKTIKIWNVKSGTCLKTLRGHKSSVQCIKILTNGDLISGSDDGTIKVWNLFTDCCLQTLTGHTASVFSLKLLPNGRLASGSGDRTIKLWSVSDGKCLKTLSGHDRAVRCLI